MRNFFIVFALLLSAALLGGCPSPPKFANEPTITFKNVEQYHLTQARRPVDSLVIVTRFEDGDGDLGLTSDDREPPFNPIYVNDNKDTIPQGEYFYNYFITMYVSPEGQTNFQKYTFPSVGGLNGRFFPLAPEGRIGPLEGDLKYSFLIPSNLDLNPGDQVKFEVYIVDKKLNKSNTITTESDIKTLFR